MLDPYIIELDKPSIAYQEDLSKHRMKLGLYDLYPRSENAWIAPNATVGKSIFTYNHILLSW
jgi:hypothetical protein